MIKIINRPFQLTQDQRYDKRVVFLINSFSFLKTMSTGDFFWLFHEKDSQKYDCPFKNEPSFFMTS